MGINITLYRILSFEKETEEWGQEYNYCKTECIKSFDYLRYSGDKEYIGRFGKFKDIDSEGEYFRPINIDEDRNWIKENIHEGNQERLLKALDLMEQDEMVVFHVSF
jgi:hypothetical protein